MEKKYIQIWIGIRKTTLVNIQANDVAHFVSYCKQIFWEKLTLATTTIYEIINETIFIKIW